MEFEVYLLGHRKFQPATCVLFTIFYSKFFRQYATYNPDILNFRRAVKEIVGFGDLTLNEGYRNRLERRREPRREI